ncbi:MAG: type IV secretion system DNA-binding domain-containing protein [Sedimentisphaerales bacterium]|jgi:hypothetical protein
MAGDETESNSSTLCERLTANFYRWEKRGRGWQLWPEPVEIEPVYEPFMHRYPGYPSSYDDGRRPTVFSSLIERIRNSLFGSKQKELEPVTEEEIQPELFQDSSPLKYLTISMSLKDKVDYDCTEQFLMSLGGCIFPVSFEIIGTFEKTTVQLVCREADLYHLKPQFEAYFPDAVVYDEGEDLNCLTTDSKEKVFMDFALVQEFMRPIRTFKGFEPDPLTGIFAALENLEKDEIGIFQVLFQPARHSWAESIARSVTDWEGKSFFADSPDMQHLAKEKIQKPLFAVCLRIASQSPENVRAWEIASALTGGLAPVSRSESNELSHLDNDGYDDSVHAEDIRSRQSRRSGMLLNIEELVSLVHPPSHSIRAAKLRRELKKTKLVPSIATGNKFVLGNNFHEGKETTVSLNSEQRLRHTHIIGATGTGKSTLLLKMIVQDIENGLGVGVLDPHGDLIDRILGYIPENRLEDVVLVDPSDSDYPVGLNILSAYSDIDKTVLSSDLVGVFKRLSTAWGDQMNSIFGNAILAFLESEKGGTLVDLRRFLVEKDFRQRFLSTVKDQDVVYYWHKVFPQLGGRLYAPILTRLDTFLRPKPIRYMVAQKEGLNFQKILDGNKIFLAKLAHGLIGTENAYLLGTIICSKFHQAAMARQAVSDTQRSDFFLYIDEFQNFVTESMTEILSGARKYHFGLVLAHQELHQLLSKDSQLASSVISNPGTRICFRIGDFDAKKLEDGFSSFDAKDLQNLGVGEAIARVERAEYDFNLKTIPPADVAAELVKQRREKLISLSRQKYALPKEKVAEELAKQKIVIEENITVSKSPEAPLDEETKQVGEEQPLYYRKKAVEPEGPSLEGIGGDKHRDIQNDIKKQAQANGFLALIENPTPDGKGKVDVHLEREGIKIAVEVCVTCPDTHELGNIEKCLSAGYDKVILCSQESKVLNKVKKLVSKQVGEAGQEKVFFFLPEEIGLFLKQEAAKSASTETIIGGRKVKTVLRPMSQDKEKTARQSVLKVLFNHIRHKKAE